MGSPTVKASEKSNAVVSSNVKASEKSFAVISPTVKAIGNPKAMVSVSFEAAVMQIEIFFGVFRCFLSCCWCICFLFDASGGFFLKWGSVEICVIASYLLVVFMNSVRQVNFTFHHIGIIHH